MRIDKYLKNSRIIKRRSIAKEACEKGRVLINEKTAKPGTEVDIGDMVEIQFGDRTLKIEVTRLADHVRKDDAREMFHIIQE